MLMHEGGGEGGKGGCNMKKVWVKRLRKFRPRLQARTLPVRSNYDMFTPGPTD